jgi:hypothetical protein
MFTNTCKYVISLTAPAGRMSGLLFNVLDLFSWYSAYKYNTQNVRTYCTAMNDVYIFTKENSSR